MRCMHESTLVLQSGHWKAPVTAVFFPGPRLHLLLGMDVLDARAAILQGSCTMHSIHEGWGLAAHYILPSDPCPQHAHVRG